MMKHLLATTALAVALAGLPAKADTIVPDPLHGYVITPTGNSNTESGGVVTPDNGLNWGFFASPAPKTGTLYIVTLTPDSSPPVGPISLTGTLTGTESPSGDWTSGTLADFLIAQGFNLGAQANGSPPNNCCGGTWGEPLVAGFNVDVASFTGVTLADLMGSTMSEGFEGGLPSGSLITAFLTTSAGTIDTANSGFLAVPDPVPGPIVGAGLPGLISGAVALWGFSWRRRRRDPLRTA